MGDATRAGNDFVVKTIVEVGRRVPEPYASVERDWGDDDVHVVDDVGVEERSDRGWPAAHSNVEPVRRILGTLDGGVRGGVEEVGMWCQRA